MINDDILAQCPDCGSAETIISQINIRCKNCGLLEDFLVDDAVREGVPPEIAQSLDKGRMRDVLMRWNFAG
ncbi:hypothetical protein [Pseudopelagicola sp. nBUS_19]|uniref:hypothetical protein n=1 Tax=unclassified Pseudopelagicola TaxID=2649563 RepID=UPI003EBBEA4D